MKTTIPHLWQQTFRRGDLIPPQPDHLWQIERGVVRTITWDEEGTPSTLGLWGLGDLIGQPLSRINPYQIECLTGVEVSALPTHLWHQALDRILSHVQQVEELLSIVRCQRVSLRLLRLLGWLSKKFGQEIDQGRLIQLRLTHQDMAEVVGTTRVTVTRLLKQYEQEGILRRYRHQLILLRQP